MHSTLKFFALLAALALTCTGGFAQTFPTKPVKLVTGNAPGGGTDTLARVISPKLSERLGQPVIVENRPGADGVIASDYVAKSNPDGYTLLVGTDGQMVLNLGLYTKLPYDPVADFVPITRISSTPLVIAVHPSLPVKSIKELIALAKAKPGTLFYASGAPAFHVATEYFKREVGVNIVFVRYKGASPALNAVLAGEVSVIMSSIGPLLSQLKAGKLRGLAVTSAKRYAIIPDIPTTAEVGLPSLEMTPWTGLFAPAGTPRVVIDRLHADMQVALNANEVRDRLAAGGVTVGGTTPAELAAIQKADIAKWTKVLKDINIQHQ